jgi:alpha-beta hydrolase superfamily lysophospholipase
MPDTENVIAVVQIIHGMAEYVERYEEFACYLTERNFVVVGEDHLGHGKSVGEDGKQGYFCAQDPATVLVRDSHRLKKMTQELYPGVPYFIIGHSMGAMLAPRIDAEGGDYNGLIMMAGSPRKLEEIMMDQNEAVLKSTKGLINWIIKKQIVKLTEMFDNLYQLSDEEAKKKKVGGGTTLYYFKEMGEHPASDYLTTTSKPMLIMQGEKDFQATVAKDFQAYKQLLSEKDNVTFKLYENLNHAFVPSVYGNIMKAKQEYNIKQHIGEEVIADIANWIKKIS